MVKENSKIFLLVLLGMLSAFGPFVTDMYLPSLPTMGDYFNTTSSMVQLGLTTSMVGRAVGQVFFGPLSDRYGWRMPLLEAMWLVLVATVCGLFAQDLQQFVVVRLVQGVAPVVAKIIGGGFTEAIGWLGIFGILLVLGMVLLVGCYCFRESLPKEKRLASKWSDTLRSFKLVLRDCRYLFYVLQMAFAQGVLFSYIASSPFIIQQHYGFSELTFSFCFAINAVAIGACAALLAVPIFSPIFAGVSHN